MRSINEPPPWGVAHCLSKQRRSQCLDKEKASTIRCNMFISNIATSLLNKQINCVAITEQCHLLALPLLALLYNTEPTRRILIALCNTKRRMSIVLQFSERKIYISRIHNIFYIQIIKQIKKPSLKRVLFFYLAMCFCLVPIIS